MVLFHASVGPDPHTSLPLTLSFPLPPALPYLDVPVVSKQILYPGLIQKCAKENNIPRPLVSPAEIPRA